MQDCLFCKIAQREIEANIVYEDEQVIAFDDIEPKAPVHQLIIPKQHIATLNDLQPEHASLVGHMQYVASQLAEEMGVERIGYRTVFNCNIAGGQMVFHIHLHLLGGRQMLWPPG